jgi:hypothetical protein
MHQAVHIRGIFFFCGLLESCTKLGYTVNHIIVSNTPTSYYMLKSDKFTKFGEVTNFVFLAGYVTQPGGLPPTLGSVNLTTVNGGYLSYKLDR